MTNPLTYFSDREREIDAFRAFLDDPACWVWNLDGLSGCGKTTLIHYLIQRVCAPQHIPTAMLDFSGELLCTDRGAVLDALENQLYAGVPANGQHSSGTSPDATAWSKAWERYHQQREKLLAELAAFRPTIKIDQRVIAREGSTIAQTEQKVEADRAYMERERQTWQQIAREFVLALSAVQGPLVIFCDTWEQVQGATPLESWLADALFIPLHHRRPATRVVIAGRQPLRCPALDTACTGQTLRFFEREESDEYLRGRGMADPDLQAAIFKVAQGHPLLTALWADLWKEAQERGETWTAADVPLLRGKWSKEAAAEWIIGRMVKRLGDARTADALRYGVVLRLFDLDALRAVLPDHDLDATWYEDFCGYAFVRRGEEKHSFHELVREVQLNWLKTEMPGEYRAAHHRALAHYEGLLGADWANEEQVDSWRGEPPATQRPWVLEALYHTWAVEPEAALEIWEELEDQARFHWRREWWRALLMLAGEDELHLDGRAAGRVLRSWGSYHTQGGELDAALDYLERGRALAEKSGDQHGVSSALYNMAYIYRVRGDLDQAMQLYHQSLEIIEALGDRQGKAISQGMMAQLLNAVGQQQEGLRLWLEAIDTLQGIGDVTYRPMMRDVRQMRQDIGDAAFRALWKKVTGSDELPEWLR